MGFKLRSGNKSSFKDMGGTEQAPAKDMKTGKYEHSFESPGKHYVDDVPGHNDGHSDDLQTPEEHEKGSKYWYKINNKPTSKAEYIKYKNKPGGDESGKQTNDPNVSLAKKSAEKRTKINK